MSFVGLWQPISREDFGLLTAPLAGCEECESTWRMDEAECGSIDMDVISCPYCRSTKTGPVYAVPDEGEK